MADIDEDGEKKVGPELFKELFRLLPSVEVEDYYRNGRWQDADVQLDIELISAHRKEAGAPEAPAIEDLEIPQLPVNGGGARFGFGAGGIGGYGPGAYPAGAARPVVTTSISGIKPAAPKLNIGIAKPASLTLSSLKPSPPKAPPSATTVAAATGGGAGPSAELRQIALFIAKWKLEATKTKLLLARLTPTRRRYVMAKFTAASGTATTPQLEQYIGQCERTNAWANADSAPAGAPAVNTGLKRPLGTFAAVSDPKRQKIVPTATSRPSGPALVSRPPAQTSTLGRISAAKPGAYGAKPAGAKPFGAKPPAVATRSAYTPLKPTTPKITSSAPRPAVSSVYKPATAKPAGAKLGGGIKPAAPKANIPKGGPPKAGGTKPGSLIKNLLNL